MFLESAFPAARIVHYRVAMQWFYPQIVNLIRFSRCAPRTSQAMPSRITGKRPRLTLQLCTALIWHECCLTGCEPLWVPRHRVFTMEEVTARNSPQELALRFLLRHAECGMPEDADMRDCGKPPAARGRRAEFRNDGHTSRCSRHRQVRRGRCGLPCAVETDRGRQFFGPLFAGLCRSASLAIVQKSRRYGVQENDRIELPARESVLISGSLSHGHRERLSQLEACRHCHAASGNKPLFASHASLRTTDPRHRFMTIGTGFLWIAFVPICRRDPSRTIRTAQRVKIVDSSD